jgi:phage tail P2-like protein
MADTTIPLPPVLASDERFKVLGQIALEAFQIDISSLLVYLVDNVDASVLPYLAEQFSLIGDGWELASTETAQCNMIKAAVEIHQHKGTPWAIKQIFVLLGLGDAEIQEGRSGYRRDGTMHRDGFPVRGDHPLRWAEYRIRLNRLLTVQQAAMAKKLLANIAPARCQLVEINFSSAALIRNGFAVRDGSYTRGIV